MNEKGDQSVNLHVNPLGDAEQMVKRSKEKQQVQEKRWWWPVRETPPEKGVVWSTLLSRTHLGTGPGAQVCEAL